MDPYIFGLFKTTDSTQLISTEKSVVVSKQCTLLYDMVKLTQKRSLK